MFQRLALDPQTTDQAARSGQALGFRRLVGQRQDGWRFAVSSRARRVMLRCLAYCTPSRYIHAPMTGNVLARGRD
jgi:hypothetical protein